MNSTTPPKQDRSNVKLQTTSLAECKVCRENIRIGAKKCIKCESFQDWRRHFSASSIVLSLLVALVSVLGWAVPTIKEELLPKREDIRFKIISFSLDKIDIIAENLGNRAAFIDSGSVKKKSKPPYESSKEKKVILATPDSINRLLYPGKWLLFSLRAEYDGAKLPKPAPNENDCEYEITLKVITFRQKSWWRLLVDSEAQSEGRGVSESLEPQSYYCPIT